jgi:XTP/dITP diphosphohydrolase
MPPLVLATRSAGKRRELGALVAEAGLSWTTLEAIGVPEDASLEATLEDADTFEGNALAKARFFLARSGGLPVLAEDSGLCVTALDGAPGVYSKRLGAAPGLAGSALDAANNAKLLHAMADAPDRSAAYVCAAVIVWPDGEVSATGRTEGRLLSAACGDGGFGYDPYFWSTELSACFGAVSMAAKATVSHRGRAIRAVLRRFCDEFAPTR